MSLNRKAILGLLCVVSMLSASCASKRVSGWFKSDDKITLTKKETNSLKSSVKKLWGKRHEKAELEKAISIYLKLSKSTDDNYDYLTRLARAYYFLADAHIEEIEAKKKTWEIGTSFGEKAMAKNEVFAKAMTEEDAKVEDHLNKLTKKEVSAMYWTAANLGKWAKNSGIATTLKYKTLIKSLISNVQKHNPSFFYYAADRYWGAFFAVAPGFAGGSMPKSKKSFEKCIEAAPTYLGTKVLFAHYYMAKEDDKKNFKKLLNEVLSSKVKDNNILSENIVEKRKAKKLLSEVDEIF
jgi:hypothetical protein